MKNRICVLPRLALLTSLIIAGICGCSAKKDAPQYQPAGQAGVKEVLEQNMADADGGNTEDTGLPEESTAPEPAEPSDGIDVDLTTLSSTMIYSEVYDMMVAPDKYVGKTIKMEGLFSGYYDDVTKKNYFACIIQDATACCAQGIEFELTDEYTYPDDYPENGAAICVVGTFDLYKEGNYTYCTLRNARLI